MKRLYVSSSPFSFVMCRNAIARKNHCIGPLHEVGPVTVVSEWRRLPVRLPKKESIAASQLLCLGSGTSQTYFAFLYSDDDDDLDSEDV